MKIVVINLERSHDRHAIIQQSLCRAGVEFEFFRAIDGSQGEHFFLSRYDERGSILEHGEPLTDDEIANFATHYLLWQRCSILKEPIVILQDDAAITDQFPRLLTAARELIGRLRLLWLGVSSDVDQRWSQGFEVVEHRIGTTHEMSGYVISPDAAANLVAHAAVWTMPVDSYISRADRHGIHSFGFLHCPVGRR